MIYPPPTKAEILITRRCNLKCSFCGMAKVAKELTSDEWAQVPNKLKELGVSFAPIYGAEPLMAFKSLLRFVGSCREVNLPCSVITNGILLTPERVESLKEVGLDSITLSIDIRPLDKDAKTKSDSALSKLECLAQNFRDVEVICTITDRDWELLPQFITEMTQKGIWVHFDFYHTNKGQPNSKCLGTEPLMPSIEDIGIVAEELVRLKEQGYLIHPSYEALLYLLTCPNQAYHQYWKCEVGSFVTVNSSGAVWCCDDFCPVDLQDRFPILEYNRTWRWEDWIKAFSSRIDECSGCFWITHVMATQQYHETNRRWIKDLTHGEVS